MVSITDAPSEKPRPNADVESNEPSLDTSAGQNASVAAEVQPGVENIEAVTSVWTTSSLIFAFVLIWLIYFVESLLLALQGSLNPFVTSAFASHSLTPTVSVISSAIGGVSNLTIAKLLDIFGRPQGFLVSIFIATIGVIMMAACNNVESYAAAQVFYTVGNYGVQYCLSVFVADSTTLRNRGFMQALSSSPNLITAWLAGPIAARFLSGAGWRWAYGTFAILIPVFTLPLYILLQINYLKARKQDLIPQRPKRGLLYYLREFDAFGLLLISAGIALFLLPFNLYALQAKQWGSPLIICFLVFGIVLILAFVVWERYFAPTTFIPYSLLLDRTVFGACILAMVLFLSYFTWSAYFQSFLQVVYDLSVEEASYLNNTYTVLTVLMGLGVGVIIHFTGRFKPITLFFAIPLSILGLGLMIHFRTDRGVGYMAMCVVFVGIGAGVIIVTDAIAVMSAASHQHIAVVLAIVGSFGNIGGAIGLTVSAAIWQNIFPARLLEYLPVEELANFELIYFSLDAQKLYPVGSPAREAIQRAYGDAMQRLFIVGTAVYAAGLLAVLMWKNIDTRAIKQTKGHVV